MLKTFKFNKNTIKSGSKKLKDIILNMKRVHIMSLKASKWLYFSLIISVILVTLIPFLSSWLSARVIDELVIAADTKIISQTVTIAIILYISSIILRRLAGKVDSYCTRMIWLDTYGYITTRMQRVFAKLDLYHHEDPKFNDTIQKAREGYSNRPSNFFNRSIAVFSDLIGIASALFILIKFSPFILLIIVISLIPSFINEIFFSKIKFGIWDADTKTRRDFFTTQYYVTNEHTLMEIKSYNLKDWFINKVDRIFFTFHNKEKKINQKLYFYDSIFTLLTIVGFAFAYWFVAEQVIFGAISIGLFTFYVATITSLSTSVDSLFQNFARIYEHSLYIDDIFKLLDVKPYIINGKQKLEKNIPLIEFKNVWFKYPNTKNYIFKNLNFTINPGDNIAIVGENGAGKSTFVKLLTRFYDVTKGEILIDGTNIKDLDINTLYKKISLLSQDFGRYHFEVKTNIALGDIENQDDINGIVEAAKLAGADEFINKYDEKYDQLLSKRFPNGIEPSSGQWQKIALARALFRHPQILILDEPTSAIDPKAESEIFDKLFSYAEEKTVIIISHRFSTVRNAEKIIVIDDGEIIEEGTHNELINIEGKYKNAFELQRKGYE